MTISKRVYSVIALVLFLVFVCPLYILPVSALESDLVDSVFEMDIGKPDISDNNGYIEILFYNQSTGSHFVRTYSWFTNAIGSYVDQTFCEITITSDYVTLSPGFHIYDTTNLGNLTVGSRLNYFWASSSGHTACSAINQYFNGESNVLKIQPQNCVVAGFHIYGNYRLLSAVNCDNEFSVLYSNDSNSFNQLITITQLLTGILNLDTDIHNDLLDIIESNDTINTKLTQVLSLLNSVDLELEDVNENLVDVNDNLEDVKDKLDVVNDKLDNVISNTDTLETKLAKIIKILESNLNTDVPTEVPKDSLNEHNSIESGLQDSLINNDYDFGPDGIQIETDFISGEPFQLCWNLVEMAISTHDYIFLIMGVAFIVGIIALILNR